MTDVDCQIRTASDHYYAQEFERAVELLSELCTQDIPEALSLLGLMYQLGDGVERSGMQAISLLKRAVELGQSVAAYNLSTIYTLGMPDVEVNIELSDHYHSKAQALDSQFVIKEI